MSASGQESNTNFEFIPGKRIDSELLFMKSEKQLFKKCTLRKHLYTYKCYVTRCPSRIIHDTLRNIIFKAKDYKVHTHGDQEKVYKELKLKTTIKTKCTDPSALVNTRAGAGNVHEVFNAVVST